MPWPAADFNHQPLIRPSATFSPLRGAKDLAIGTVRVFFCAIDPRPAVFCASNPRPAVFCASNPRPAAARRGKHGAKRSAGEGRAGIHQPLTRNSGTFSPQAGEGPRDERGWNHWRPGGQLRPRLRKGSGAPAASPAEFNRQPQNVFARTFYSYRRASIGSSRAALYAG